MTRTAGAPIGCQRPSRFWGLGCPKIYHEAEDTLVIPPLAVQCAEATVTISLRLVAGDILGPQQLQGHPFALEFLVDLEAIG
ncbi:hypothetical protein, partial [Thiolapillus sp.]